MSADTKAVPPFEATLDCIRRLVAKGKEIPADLVELLGHYPATPEQLQAAAVEFEDHEVVHDPISWREGTTWGVHM